MYIPCVAEQQALPREEQQQQINITRAAIGTDMITHTHLRKGEREKERGEKRGKERERVREKRV
jgi:hypothetical protein